MSASSAAVAPSSELVRGRIFAARREASSARCCRAVRSTLEAVFIEKTSLASTRSRSVPRPSRVTAARRSVIARPLEK